MKNNEEVAENYGSVWLPKCMLVFYQSNEQNTNFHVEHFEMDSAGNPMNAHPLTVREATRLAKRLKAEEEESGMFKKSRGLMGTRILQIDPRMNGVVTWYTKSTVRNFFFTDGLGIPNGIAAVPPMLWMANREKLFVYALKSNRRPTIRTELFHAPFFNVYSNGNVCMGTVDINIKKSASLEDFTRSWEDYFFNSYFSHLIGNHNPIDGNIVNLWMELINTDKPFPSEVLKKSFENLKNLLL